MFGWSKRREHRVGEIFVAPFDVVFSEFDVVEPDLDVIRIYRAVDRRYQRVAELTLVSGDVLTTPLMPDLTLPLGDIFPVEANL